jgi:hypothetical protein
MPVNIAWALNVQVPQGPNLAASSQVEVDAYDKVNVMIAAGVTDKSVELQPGGSGQVRFLFIRSNVYGDGLTYKVNNTANPAHKLNDFLLLTGQGSVALLGFAPNSLLFSNSLPGDAVVEILVGRQATT